VWRPQHHEIGALASQKVAVAGLEASTERDLLEREHDAAARGVDVLGGLEKQCAFLAQLVDRTEQRMVCLEVRHGR